MRTSALIFSSILALAFACTAHAEQKSAEPAKMGLAWNLSLDAQGHVVQLTPIADKRADRVPQIREQLEQKIHAWPFIPGTVDGRPAATETVLSVEVSLLPNDENSYRIRFDDVRTGGRIAKVAGLHYPLSAVKARQTGMVVLRVAYDGDGKVTSAAVEPGSSQPPKALVEASIDSAKAWVFQPERVDGHGVAGTQVLPMCFTIVGHATPRELGDCHWQMPGRNSAIGEGESLAINPVARLASDIAGHAL